MAAEMKQIAILMPSLDGGGVQRSMLTLSKGLVEQGFLVDFVLVKAQGSFINHVPVNARVIDLGASRALSALPRLVSYLRENNPSALISAQTHINAIAIIARKLSRVKTNLIVSERNDLLLATQSNNNFKEKFRPMVVRFLYPYADHIVAVSNGVAKDIARILPGELDRVCVIYNSIDVLEIQQKAQSLVEHPWVNQSGIPFILAVGRLEKQKDYPTLLGAFAILIRNMPARLIILGEGEERADLEKLITSLGISSDVSMPGFIENPYAYMSRANVFVLSSAWEGFPNVLAEALACNVPVVSTDCHSGPAEILDNGRYGSLVPVGDVNGMAQAIISVLHTSFIYSESGDRVKEFSVERTVQAYLNIL